MMEVKRPPDLDRGAVETESSATHVNALETTALPSPIQTGGDHREGPQRPLNLSWPPPPRKRPADALGRLAESSSSHTGRGSTAGWTTCPLCGPFSSKRYALGRGIAAHLRAVHTPWNPPGRVERNKRRRLAERRIRASQRPGQSHHHGDDHHHHSEGLQESTTPSEALPPPTTSSLSVRRPPTTAERESWDREIFRIVADLEGQAHHDASTEDTTNRTDGHTNSSQVEIVQAGFDRNGEECQPYRHSLPPFIQAAADGDESTLRALLAQAESQGPSQVLDLLNTRDRNLSGAEHWAAGSGHLTCLQFLTNQRQAFMMMMMESGDGSTPSPPPENNSSHRRSHVLLEEASSGTADPQKKKVRRRDGKTCLHYAARNGQVACLRYLLHQVGHSVDERSGDGTTPFHLACFGGHVEAAKFLVEHGADAQAKNDWGCTAAHWVSMSQSSSPQDIRALCNLLHQAGVSFAERQTQGHSPLHKAAQRKNRWVIEWMLQSAEAGGAGYTAHEIQAAARPDDGGHRPSDIWLGVGGEQALASRLRRLESVVDVSNSLV